uniref:TIR domain-containing protein n=1 Tax=Gopherus agassizii TaxID=38772 RepID=A0A452HIF0_9SAUR
LTTNIFIFACIFTFTLWNNIQLSMENEFTAHYSSSFLAYKNISELHISDFSSLPELQVLNLSHNLIRELDFSVFKFNEKLECLDLSHNNLWNMCCQTLAGLRHLDLSFNKFNTLPICQEFGNMLNLEDLGLSATMIRKSDFRGITHLQLHTVFLTLEDLAHYEAKSLIKLELSNIIYNSTDFPFPPFDPLKFKTLNLRFNNVDLSWSILVRIFMIVWSTPVEYFTVKKLTFRGSVQSTTNTDFSLLSYWAQSVYSGSSMKALILDHICTKNENHCHWVRTLAKLNLSSNKLTDSVFGCLPINVQILDLQNNQIRMVPKDITELKALKELNIAFNRLAELPGCSHFRGLELLNIEENSILIPSSDFFHSCQNIRELRGGHNPFQCSCELRDFVNFEKKSGGRLVGWPESYVCEYPDDLKGTELKDFQLSELSCNTTLLLVIALVVTVVVVAVTSFLCIYFDIMWYLKMMWQWTQTKRRVRKSHPEDLQSILQFHAFISYSERDSLWVKNHLIPNLEKEDGSVQICLHERNFIPGKSIVENIINCIEKSHKSIFVLSPNFVQIPSLILILLEPIPQYLIPARYHKLKALMAKRTYLEWPKEKSKHGLFWANLKATLNSNLPISAKVVVETD